MKNLLLLSCIVVIFLSGNVFAQCTEDENRIAIFFDGDCSECDNCESILGGQVSAYVVLLNCTQPAGVGGFEFCLCNEDGSPFSPPPGYLPPSYSLPPGAINAGTAPCFYVGLWTPLYSSPCMVLLKINLYVSSPNPWCFGVKPTPMQSIPGQMAYGDGIDKGLIIPMYPITSNSYSLACINSMDCLPVVPVEGTTWGSVKNLYRIE